jgi:TctA family transporter
MKFDQEMLKQLLLIIVGVLAALFGYDVVTGDDEVTISLPEQVEEAPAAEEAASEEADASEEPASEE